MSLNYYNNGYLEIFKDPKWFHLAFERDVSKDVSFILDYYEKKFHRAPRKVYEFESNNTAYGREFTRLGLPAVCFNSNKKFANFCIDKLGCHESLFSSNLYDPIFKDSDLILCLFDTTAFFKNDEEYISILNYLYDCLSPEGLLVIQSNTGVDLSYIDYSKVFNFETEGFDKQSVRTEWALGVKPGDKWERTNQVKKKISIMEEDHIVDSWEKTSQELTFNDLQTIKSLNRSDFKDRYLIDVFSDLVGSQFDSNSYEICSFITKKKDC